MLSISNYTRRALTSSGALSAKTASAALTSLHFINPLSSSGHSDSHSHNHPKLSRQGHQVRTLYQAPLKEIKFLMNEVNDFQGHYAKLKKTNVEGAAPDMLEAILSEMAKFAEQELAPIDEGADRVGCKQIGPNEIKTPPGFKEAYDNFVAGGWQGLSFPEEYGGQGLPSSLALIQAEMTSTACWTWTMFPGLSKGAINTLISHGSKKLQEKYLKKLVSGEYTGTMCLTEPQCGSDLAQVSTKAEPQADGTYKITGTKIFISCGEHDLTENIIHCVLARLPNAPEGTRGISLFAVPKKLENGELNHAPIGRIEEKMGCHGSPTCEINFEGAIGELIGTENKGLNHMFTFINTSRIGTAIQGLAACEGSYQNALAYAKERRAMRALTRKPDDGDKRSDLIIAHPSVRAMLLTQKSYAEGGRSMILECAMLEDKKQDYLRLGTPEGKSKAKKIEDRLGFLTPILKGFLTEKGTEAANLGIQIFGGHGYIASNKQEQIARDVRIASVWEGTTQIQALDLLGRKIMLQKLMPLFTHCNEMYKLSWTTLRTAKDSWTRINALKVFKATLDLQMITLGIAGRSLFNKNGLGIASEPYLMYCGYLQLGAHLLKMQNIANLKLLEKDSSKKQFEDKFYRSKAHTARFYFDWVFPRLDGLRKTMFTFDQSIMGLKDDEFSFLEK